MITAKWDITSKCNLRCKHCSVASTYFSDRTCHDINLAEKIALLDNMANGGVRHLSLLGGEPLTLQNELLTIISYAKSIGMTVGLVTNGILLCETTCRDLIDIGLDRITVSVESTQAEQHDQIRGRGSFAKTIANLYRFADIRGRRECPKLSINSVLSQVNRTCFVDIIRLCGSLQADEWTALTLNHIGNAETHLPSLTVEPREHTEVALELAMQLPSVDLKPGFRINMQLIYPLVWEYIIKRYKVRPPWPQICCSAARSLIYVAPDGGMHLCDRVHGSLYSDGVIMGERIQPIDLTINTFALGWTSAQYAGMFQFARAPETYQNYAPCRRCKYLAVGLCEPCPLYSLEKSDIVFSQCLQAEEFLGNISGSVDWSLIPADEQRGRYEETWSGEDHRHSEGSVDVLARLIPFAGVRHFRYPNGDGIVYHPQTMETLKLNPMANAIWESVDGHRTTGEIADHALRLYSGVAQSLGRRSPAEVELVQLAARTESFLKLLQERGFLAKQELSGLAIGAAKSAERMDLFPL